MEKPEKENLKLELELEKDIDIFRQKLKEEKEKKLKIFDEFYLEFSEKQVENSAKILINYMENTLELYKKQKERVENFWFTESSKLFLENLRIESIKKIKDSFEKFKNDEINKEIRKKYIENIFEIYEKVLSEIEK